MQWMTMTSFVLHAPQHAAASPFGPLNLRYTLFLISSVHLHKCVCVCGGGGGGGRGRGGGMGGETGRDSVYK